MIPRIASQLKLCRRKERAANTINGFQLQCSVREPLLVFSTSDLPVHISISMGVVRSFCGFTAILVAVFAVWLSLPPSCVELSPDPGPLPSPLTEAQQQEYADNGVVLLKQLFKSEQLAELISESKKALKKRDLMDFVATSYHKLVFGLWRTRTPFAKVAFESSMPSIAQQLLHEEKSVRILKV
jgi:hypothetical protein